MSEINLIEGDCLEIMDLVIPDNSVDLTVTSPPYDNLREYNGMKPFTFEVFKPIANALYKVTSPNGVVIWNVNDAVIDGGETGSSFKQALYFISIGFKLHDTMIYRKANPLPSDKSRYQQEFEYIFVLKKGDKIVFNPIKEPCKMAGKKQSKSTYYRNGDALEPQRKERIYNSEKLRGNIWTYAVGSHSEYKHPARFPEQFAIDCISSWSNPASTVFDPFLGSGTTGFAAKTLDRNFIGTERDPTYFKIAEARINATEGLANAA